nr:hypothetical protein [Tanacetum cinerariifolium]
MKDPGLFTLPCRLEDSKPFNTLADLGSFMNLIPLYLFKKLKIGLLEETDHVFGLSDGTNSYPIRIVKNVEVHIGLKSSILEHELVLQEPDVTKGKTDVKDGDEEEEEDEDSGDSEGVVRVVIGRDAGGDFNGGSDTSGGYGGNCGGRFKRMVR